MIYKREEYVQEAEAGSKFPVRQIEALVAVEDGTTRYVGHLTLGLQTPMGVQQVPVTFDIEAGSIELAFQKFDSMAEPRIDETRKQIEEEIARMRQEASNRIVRPGEVGMGGGAGGGGVIDFDSFKK